MSRRLRACVFVVVASGLVHRVAAAEEAPDTKECVTTYDRAQALRDDHKLLEARAAFLRCAHHACPAVLVKDCSEWLHEVEARTPTLVLRVTDDRGRDAMAANVLLDGRRLGTPLGV